MNKLSRRPRRDRTALWQFIHSNAERRHIRPLLGNGPFVTMSFLLEGPLNMGTGIVFVKSRSKMRSLAGNYALDDHFFAHRAGVRDDEVEQASRVYFALLTSLSVCRTMILCEFHALRLCTRSSGRRGGADVALDITSAPGSSVIGKHQTRANPLTGGVVNYSVNAASSFLGGSCLRR